MKNFSFTSLPDAVTYSGKVYKYATGAAIGDNITKQYAQANGFKLIQINVLSRQLKGKTDLHNKPYQPSAFYFSFPEMSHTQKSELSDLIRNAQN